MHTHTHTRLYAHYPYYFIDTEDRAGGCFTFLLIRAPASRRFFINNKKVSSFQRNDHPATCEATSLRVFLLFLDFLWCCVDLLLFFIPIKKGKRKRHTQFSCLLQGWVVYSSIQNKHFFFAKELSSLFQHAVDVSPHAFLFYYWFLSCPWWVSFNIYHSLLRWQRLFAHTQKKKLFSPFLSYTHRLYLKCLGIGLSLINEFGRLSCDLSKGKIFKRGITW